MQMLSRVALRSWIIGATTAALLVTAPTAFAEPDDVPRTPSGSKQVTSCDSAGLDGSLLDSGDLTASKSESNGRYLTVRAVSDGITITGIVVAGGHAYNLYVPGERGMAAQAPWQRLHAPRGNAAKPPVIKHWFACGVSTPDTSSAAPPVADRVVPAKTAPLDADSTAASVHSTSATSSGRESPAARRGVRITSTTPPAEPTRRSSTPEALAYTGFGDAGLVVFGLVLVLAGSAALVLLRVRRHRR